MLKGMKYKLWMFGIEIIENETKKLGKNNAVILNSPVPESRVQKKHHLINYKYVLKAVDSCMAMKYKVDTGSNISDPFTKLLDKVKRKEII